MMDDKEEFQTFGPFMIVNGQNEKLYSLCRHLFPQLSKRDLRNCFKNSEIFVNNEAVKGSEDEIRRLHPGREFEIKLIRNIDYYKRQQMKALNLQICYQKQNVLVSFKPSGVNGSIGRLYDEALLYSYSLSTTTGSAGTVTGIPSSPRTPSSERSKELYAIYRFTKSIAGLYLYATTLSSYQMLRKLLCLNLCQLSFVCIVVGDVQQTATGAIIPLPVSFGALVGDQPHEAESEDNENEDNDDEINVNGDPIENHCVMHSLKIEVLQRSPGHRIGSLSLLRVTPSFLEEYSSRAIETLLKPSSPADYQYLHYPVSVIKAIPKALRLSGCCVIGGDRGLVKASKGLYFSLDQIRFSSSEVIQDRLRTVEDCPSDWESIAGDLISVPIPERFTKLLNHKTSPAQPQGEAEGEVSSALHKVATFHGLTFQISSAVMTPRPASETLVRQALLIARQRFASTPTAAVSGSPLFSTGLRPVRLLDLGTGSGCLLLACLHYLRQDGIPCYGVGIDLCDKALHIAKLNASLLSLENHTTFLQHSFTDLSSLSSCLLKQQGQSQGCIPSQAFDIVLCNPPYSALKEDRVSHFRRLHEPAIALFADASLSLPSPLDLSGNSPPPLAATQLPVFHSQSSHESLLAFRAISSSLRQLLHHSVPSSSLASIPPAPALLAPQCVLLIEFGKGQQDDVVKIFSGNGDGGLGVTGIFSDDCCFPRCLRLEVASEAER
jgi:methylase of polypeptide subunit release factors/23S rRNA-/tRNA-specific pseudouridylate synthase